MKTAISVPDGVFRRVTRYAKKLGISRSELFTRAAERFLDEQVSQDVRASYDRAFGAHSGEDDVKDFRRHGVKKALLNVEW